MVRCGCYIQSNVMNEKNEIGDWSGIGGLNVSDAQRKGFPWLHEEVLVLSMRAFLRYQDELLQIRAR